MPFKLPVGYRDNGDGNFVVFNFDDNDMISAINSVYHYLILPSQKFSIKAPTLFDIYEKIYVLQQDFKAEKKEENKKKKNARNNA